MDHWFEKDVEVGGVRFGDMTPEQGREVLQIEFGMNIEEIFRKATGELRWK